MLKLITAGFDLMPPPFANGLDVWSRTDGTPGGATYDSDPNARIVSQDSDFGSALELVKTQATQRLRYTGETPLAPGCFLRVSARVKAVSGPFAVVRIAAWPGQAGGRKARGLIEAGPERAMTRTGEVVDISAVIGADERAGVDMPWGAAPLYAHVGLDLIGPTGGVIRIESLKVEEIAAL